MNAPKIEDAKEICRNRKLDAVIVLAVDVDGRVSFASYGRTKKLCQAAAVLGDVAFDAVERSLEV